MSDAEEGWCLETQIWLLMGHSQESHRKGIANPLRYSSGFQTARCMVPQDINPERGTVVSLETLSCTDTKEHGGT